MRIINAQRSFGKTSFNRFSKRCLPSLLCSSFITVLLFLPPPYPQQAPHRLLLPPPPSPPLPDSSPPCNYHLRLQLKETTIKRAEEGDQGVVRNRERGQQSERQRGEFNETFVHPTHPQTHTHTHMQTPKFVGNTTFQNVFFQPAKGKGEVYK